MKWVLREITDARAGGPRCRGEYRADDQRTVPHLHRLFTPVELPPGRIQLARLRASSSVALRNYLRDLLNL
jgi:hypothetical protein